MSVRAIDSNRDWVFGQGKQSYRNNIDEIQQMVRTRVLSFLNDCFFAMSEGIDWLNLLGKGSDLEERLKRSISSTILQTDGITRLNSIELLRNPKRELVLTYSVNTIYSVAYNDTIEVNNG